MFSLKSCLRTLGFISVGLTCSAPMYAAKAIDLSKQGFYVPSAHHLAAGSAASKTTEDIKVNSSHTDENQVTHIRVQQLYANYPVWNAHGIIHTKQSKVIGGGYFLVKALATNEADTTRNGVFYTDINKDLAQVDPKQFDTDEKKQKALHFYKQQLKNINQTSYEKINVTIYVDANNTAHVAYIISFLSEGNGRPRNPTAIIDAQTYKLYKSWDNIKTLDAKKFGDSKPITALGYGGNPVEGEWYYGKDKPTLSIIRSEKQKLCVIANKDVEVLKYSESENKKYAYVENVGFPCPIGNIANEPDKGHFGQYNGAYSLYNDALYYGILIKNLYKDWYNTTVLTDLLDQKTPLLLRMNLLYLDEPFLNAFWNPQTRAMYFGLGNEKIFPFVTLDVAAHEISHGFTDENSDLAYLEQSGALNESFSDMAAVAASAYESNGANIEWTIGRTLFKQNVGRNRDNQVALRYINAPKQDRQSIINVNAYDELVKWSDKKAYEIEDPKKPDTPEEHEMSKQGFIVHLASGIYNNIYARLATAPGWTPRLAFGVMLKANKDYWTTSETFASAACGIKKAAYDVAKMKPSEIQNALEYAFAESGISLNNC